MADLCGETGVAIVTFVAIDECGNMDTASATFTIDLRHPEASTLARLGDRIAGICEAHRGPCPAALPSLGKLQLSPRRRVL